MKRLILIRSLLFSMKMGCGRSLDSIRGITIMNSKLTLLLIVIFLSCSYSVTYSADEPDINDAVSKRAIEVEIQVRWKEKITALAGGEIERALTYNWYRLCGNHT